MLLLNLIVAAIILLPAAFWFLIKECKRANKAFEESEQQHKAQQVVFTREDYQVIDDNIDLTYEWSEMPHYIAN